MGCNNRPCGCSDQEFNVPDTYDIGTTSCPGAESCEEIVYTKCTKSIEETFLVYDAGSDLYFKIEKNDTLDVILKKFALYLTAPTCYDPSAANCRSVVDFRVIAYTNTTATLYWTQPMAGLTYTVQYSTNLLSWTTVASGLTISSGTTREYEIINLSANTAYYIRLVSNSVGVSPAESCNSVIINLTTEQ